MAFVRKHRRKIAAAAVFLATLAVFFAFWRLRLSEASTKARSAYLNDAQDTATAALAPGGELRQRIETDLPLYGLGVVPLFEGEAPQGALRLSVYGADGTRLAEATGNAPELLSGTWAVFVFEEAVQQPGGVYDLVLTAETGAAAVPVAFAKSAAALPGWRLAEEGAPAAGSLCVLAVYERIGAFAGRLYAVFAVLAGAALGGLYWLAARRKLPLHKLYAVAAAVLGLLYCFFLPPYSSPDEQFHINQTFTFSSALMGQSSFHVPWGQNVRRAGDVNALVQDKDTTIFTYREITREFFTLTPDAAPTVFEGEGVSEYNLLYLPAALGVTLGRLLRLGFVPVLFLGRLCNLAFYIGLTALAVRLLPVGRAALCVLGLLPMSLHLAASFNRDAAIIALYTFFTAYCLRLLVEKRDVGGREMAVMALVGLVAGPGKWVYSPLVFLCLLLPPGQFRWRGRPMARRAARLCKAGIVALGCLALAVQLFAMRGALRPAPTAMPGEGPAQAQAAGQEEAPASQPDSAVFGVRYVLSHPRQTFWLVVNSVAGLGTFYWQTMLGGNLGYFSLELNWFFVLALTLVLFVALVPVKGEVRLAKPVRRWGALMALVCAALVVAGCILWTPTDYQTIYGIQGRYFLPLMPLLLCCVRSWMPVLQKRRSLAYETVFATSALSLFALLNAFLLVMAR